MMIGIALTPGSVAIATTFARDRMAFLIARHGTSLARASQVLDAVAGALLVAVGVAQFL
jgi:ABC-type nickel/cobalt efflux system permease component RcnA